MTTVLTKTADRLLRAFVPAVAASAAPCGLYIGHCYVTYHYCSGSACVTKWQCANSQTDYWCVVDAAGQRSSWRGCC
jgi:hypothetical protein